MADGGAADTPPRFGLPALALSAAPIRAELNLVHVDADQRWSLAAGAVRAEWDPLERPAARAGFAASRFAARDALGGESSRARVAFDWQRTGSALRLYAHAFATRSRLDLEPDRAPAAGALDQRYRHRDERARFGVVLGMHDAQPFLGLAGARSFTLRAGSDTQEAFGSLHNAFHGAATGLRLDRMRQSGISLEAAQELGLAPGIRAHAALQVASLHASLDSPRLHGQGALGANIATGQAGFSWRVTPRSTLFIDASQGPTPGEPSTLLALDPRHGAPLPAIDPRTRASHTEAGIRTSWGDGLETRLAAWRAGTQSELRFDGTEAWSEIARAGVRQGLRASLRYEPVRWLALDVDAAVARARYADGAGEAIPFAAERFATAGATLRGGKGWTASLLVRYLGRRSAAEDDLLRMRSSTAVGAQVVHKLSKKTRVSFDVFNVFDRQVGGIDHFAASRAAAAPGAVDNFLFHPSEPRGFRIKLRTTF